MVVCKPRRNTFHEIQKPIETSKAANLGDDADTIAAICGQLV
jgi:ADP-ribosylglycohydrolase